MGHTIHTEHPHSHNEHCGHTAIEHNNHIDYVHDGHLHTPHAEHYDEHVIEISAQNPADCAPIACACGHTNCGHDTVPHGDHVDYLYEGQLHHRHGDHCDNHGQLVTK